MTARGGYLGHSITCSCLPCAVYWKRREKGEGRGGEGVIQLPVKWIGAHPHLCMEEDPALGCKTYFPCYREGCDGRVVPLQDSAVRACPPCLADRFDKRRK